MKYRKAVSMNAGTYFRFRNLCRKQGIPLARRLEELILAHCENCQEPPVPDYKEIMDRRREHVREKHRAAASGIFTF
jgi:hypothetical protein